MSDQKELVNEMVLDLYNIYKEKQRELKDYESASRHILASCMRNYLGIYDEYEEISEKIEDLMDKMGEKE